MSSRLAFVLALAVSAIAYEGLALAQPAGGADSAEVAFKKGNELYAAQRYADAEQAYLRAWASKKTFDIATNLGHAQFKQGKYRDAAEHFDFALQNYPATSAVQDQRELLRRAFEEAKKQVGSLRVRVTVVGASVLVDEREVGTAPLRSAVFVDPGPHVVAAKLSGYRPASENVDAQRGGDRDITLTLEVDPAARGGTSAPATPGETSRVSVAWFVAGGMLAAGGFALGIAGTVVANGSASDASRLQASVGNDPSACAPPRNASGDCAALESAAKSRQTWSGAAIGGFIGGGVLALGTAGLLLWDRSRGGTDAPKGGHVEVTPVVGGDRGGFVIQGAW